MDNKDLFCENDPRSYCCKRIHLKPRINYYYILINLFLSITFFVMIGFVLDGFISKYLDSISIAIIYIYILIIILYFIFEFKYIVVFTVKLYQRFAPEYIRDKCRFEPSCSNYMLMAIKKHGLLRGFLMGINRLKRCNINHGGYDEP